MIKKMRFIIFMVLLYLIAAAGTVGAAQVVRAESRIAVIYHANNGRLLTSDGKKVITAAQIMTTSKNDTIAKNITSVTRDGYEFLGWSEYRTASSEKYMFHQGVGTNWVAKIHNQNGGRITLYAVWKKEAAKKVTATFDANGGNMKTRKGNVIATYNQQIAQNSWAVFTSPEIVSISKSGYTFEGWAKHKNDTVGEYSLHNGVSNEWINMVSKSYGGKITLYAVWKPQSVKVTFDSNGGSLITNRNAKISTYTQTILPDKRATFAAPEIVNATRTGYTFKGWAKHQNDTAGEYSLHNGVSNEWIDMVNKSYGGKITLYAVWKKEAASQGSSQQNSNVTVTFDANGGSMTTGKNQKVSVYSQTIAPNTRSAFCSPDITGITKDGYSFEGWAIQKNATVAEYSFHNSVGNGWIDMIRKSYRGKVTVYAVWKPKTICMTFNANGGNMVKTNGEYITIFTQNVKAGTNAMFAWPDVSKLYRNGYKFLGWSDNKNATKGTYTIHNGVNDHYVELITRMNKGKVTLYAIWEKEQVKEEQVKATFKFYDRITLLGSKTYISGKSETVTYAPARNGYTFIGWGTSAGNTDVIIKPNGIVTDDIIAKYKNKTTNLYALFQQNAVTKAKATFNFYNGRTLLGTKTFTEKESQKVTYAPTKQGYTFVGWTASEKDKTIVVKPNSSVDDATISKYNGKTTNLYAAFEKNETRPVNTRTNASRSNGTFEIQYFVGPSLQEMFKSGEKTSQVVQDIVDAGFTICFLRPSHTNMWYYGEPKENDNTNLLNAIDTLSNVYNLKTYLELGATVSDIPFSGGVASVKGMLSTVPVVNQALAKDSVIGVMLVDEPGIENLTKTSRFGFSTLRDGVIPLSNEIYRQTGKYVFTNLLPNNVNESSLDSRANKLWHSLGDRYDWAAKETESGKYFTDYLRKFALDAKGSELLSIDHYLMFNGNGASLGVDFPKLRAVYYNNLIQLMNAAKGTNKIPMNHIALHGLYVDPNSKGQIMFQVNTCLAYGVKRLSYFTYRHPNSVGWSRGFLVDQNCNKSYPTYNYVSDINKWAFNIGNMLFNKTISSINTVEGSNIKTLYGANKINSALGNVSCNNNKLCSITTFTDNTIMIVNGDPNSSVVINIPNLTNYRYYQPCTNVFEDVRFSGNYEVKDNGGTQLFTTMVNKVQLSPGSAIILSR